MLGMAGAGAGASGAGAGSVGAGTLLEKCAREELLAVDARRLQSALASTLRHAGLGLSPSQSLSSPSSLVSVSASSSTFTAPLSSHATPCPSSDKVCSREKRATIKNDRPANTNTVLHGNVTDPFATATGSVATKEIRRRKRPRNKGTDNVAANAKNKNKNNRTGSQETAPASASVSVSNVSASPSSVVFASSSLPAAGDETRKKRMAELVKEQQTSKAPRYTGCRNDKAKPPYSYASLIAQALLSAPSRKLTLSSIYAWIMNAYPYYRSENCGWQNSIRHNLSLNRCFTRLQTDLSQEELHGGNKGAFWTIDEALMDDFEDGMFKRRKYGQGRTARRPSAMSNCKKRRRLSVSGTSPAETMKKLTIEDELFPEIVSLRRQHYLARSEKESSSPSDYRWLDALGMGANVVLSPNPRLDQSYFSYDLEADGFVGFTDSASIDLLPILPYSPTLATAQRSASLTLASPSAARKEAGLVLCPELAEAKWAYQLPPPTFSDYFYTN